MTLHWYRPLCFCHANALVSIETTWFTQQIKDSEFCIKTRSPPASLPSRGQVTEQTTVKWSIRKWLICERLDEIPRYSRDTTALQLNWGSITSCPYNSKLFREKSFTQTKASYLQFVFYTGPDFNTKISAPYILYVSNKSECFSFRSSPRHYFKFIVGVKSPESTDPARNRRGRVFCLL